VILVAICTWIVFSIRDYCLLRAGPASEFRRHVRLYAASVLITAAVICLTLAKTPSSRVLQMALSPLFLRVAIGWHVAMGALCLWFARRGKYDSSWRLALAPLPAPWIFLVMAAGDLYPANSGVVVLGASAAWLVVLGLVARFDRLDAAASDELEFSMRFAAWSNCMAWCLVPLMMQ
jgi:hypothetical protein